MLGMLSSLVLVALLSLSNAQWPLQSIGYEDGRPIPKPLNQPGYPYGYFENVPYNPELNIPNIIDEKHGHPIEESKFIHNPKPFKADSKLSADDIHKKLPIIKFPSSFPIANVNLGNDVDVRDRMTYLLNNGLALRNHTDKYMKTMNLYYLNLAIDEDDNRDVNENTYKYGVSVILRFLIEFYRVYRKVSARQAGIQLIDTYGASYDKAIAIMKEKRDFTPLQIAVPVRRVVDIFKSILFKSVQIVQVECNRLDPNWKCVILYLAHLISESAKCSNVWYHAFIHMVTLEAQLELRDSIVYKITSLNQFSKISGFQNAFDFIIEKLQEYKEHGRVQLSTKAVIYTMIADLQEAGLLDCISIDNLYNS